MPSALLRSLAAKFSPGEPDAHALVPPSPLDAVANLLSIHPIHVDHVAEAICIAADQARSDVNGVVGVAEMRELIGWSQKGQARADLSTH